MRTTVISFILAVVVFFGCSTKTDQEYMKNAYNLVKDNKIKEAVKEFEALVEEYPGSDAAPTALFELGKIYQGKIDKDIEPSQANEKAIGYFKRVSSEYPKSKEAAPALFMIAFIQANELKKYDEAKVNYEKFIAQYPDHELTASAKQELQFLGIPPEQIIMQNQSAGK